MVDAPAVVRAENLMPVRSEKPDKREELIRLLTPPAEPYGSIWEMVREVEERIFKSMAIL